MKRAIVPIALSLVIFMCLVCALELIPNHQSSNNLVYTPPASSGTPSPSTGNMSYTQNGSMGDNSTPQPETSPTATPTPEATPNATFNLDLLKFTYFINRGSSNPSEGSSSESNEKEDPVPTTEPTEPTTSPSSEPTTTTSATSTGTQEDTGIDPPETEGDEVTEVPEFPTMIIPVLIIAAAVFLKTRER